MRPSPPHLTRTTWIVLALAVALPVSISSASSTASPNSPNSSSLPPGKQAPSNTSLPSISGTAQQDQTLTASPGVWSGSGATYAYQWQRCDSTGNGCAPIGGETGQSYLLG